MLLYIKELFMDWTDIDDSTTIKRIAYSVNDLYVEFLSGGVYQYLGVGQDIYMRILRKECISKSEGKPSCGATLDQLVKKAGYQYKRIK